MHNSLPPPGSLSSRVTTSAGLPAASGTHVSGSSRRDPDPPGARRPRGPGWRQLRSATRPARPGAGRAEPTPPRRAHPEPESALSGWHLHERPVGVRRRSHLASSMDVRLFIRLFMHGLSAGGGGPARPGPCAGLTSCAAQRTSVPYSANRCARLRHLVTSHSRRSCRLMGAVVRASVVTASGESCTERGNGDAWDRAAAALGAPAARS